MSCDFYLEVGGVAERREEEVARERERVRSRGRGENVRGDCKSSGPGRLSSILRALVSRLDMARRVASGTRSAGRIRDREKTARELERQSAEGRRGGPSC